VLPKKTAQMIPETGGDLIAALGLQPILFDLDRSEIREDASSILKEASVFLIANDSIKIEIQSHTDAKGSKSYNQRLSQARAKQTYDYLIALGVNPKSLTFKGYGESNLLNNCENWERCSKGENEKNRRSELIVISKP
jgi:outer membrane protein OmpA-like peptidoglycan-associated protein